MIKKVDFTASTEPKARGSNPLWRATKRTSKSLSFSYMNCSWVRTDVRARRAPNHIIMTLGFAEGITIAQAIAKTSHEPPMARHEKDEQKLVLFVYEW